MSKTRSFPLPSQDPCSDLPLCPPSLLIPSGDSHMVGHAARASGPTTVRRPHRPHALRSLSGSATHAATMRRKRADLQKWIWLCPPPQPIAEPWRAPPSNRQFSASRWSTLSSSRPHLPSRRQPRATTLATARRYPRQTCRVQRNHHAPVLRQLYPSCGQPHHWCSRARPYPKAKTP